MSDDIDSKMNEDASISLSKDNNVLYCAGGWEVKEIASLRKQFKKILQQVGQVNKIDASAISNMDSAGAHATY